jgi:FkbM family methyltransferase
LLTLTSVYFVNRWPKARIIAIEPEPSNYSLLLKNAQPYPQITTVLAALWKEPVMLNLFNPGKGEWAFQTKVSADGKTHGMTLDEVMQTYQLDGIDLLMMDIKGAEKRSVREALVGRSRRNPGD